MNSKPSLKQQLAVDASTLTSILTGISFHANESLVAQIYRILWDSIVTLKILPGQMISEKEIAAALKASKTPVREALIRLEEVGLVRVIPKSGTYVTAIRIDAYIEGCFTRLQLETGAVRRAAERSGEDDRHINKLESILEEQTLAWNAEDYVQFAHLDEVFHRAFFEVAGLHGVWHFLQKTQADVNRIRHLKRINGIRRGTQVLEQHESIVKSIKTGNADAAGDALVDHIGSLESEIEKMAQFPEILAFIESQNTVTKRKQSANPRNKSIHSQQLTQRKNHV